MRFIALSLVLTTVSEILSYFFAYYRKYELRCATYHFYDVIESILCASFFIFALKPYFFRTAIIANLIFWPAIAILNIIFLQPLSAINTNMIMVESFVFITLSLMYIYVAVKKSTTENIFRSMVFQMVVLFLFAESSSFFFFALINFLFDGNWKYRNLAMYLQSVAEIVIYLTMAAILFFSKNRTQVTNEI
jgi:hypothetical protein